MASDRETGAVRLEDRLSSVSPPSGRPRVAQLRSMSSVEEIDLVSSLSLMSLMEIDLAGGSGLVLGFVFDGEPLSEEVS